MSPALRHALPLLAVTFVNRMASLGLSLLPAMLVDREAGALAAALAMGVARSAMLVGTLGSGIAADRWGLRPILVASTVLAAAGVAGMGIPGPLPVLVLAAGVAQVGVGTFPTAARLALVGLVPVEHQREALAWQRSVTNLGLVGSFGLGWLLGAHLGLLLALDAASSLAAGLLVAAVPVPERGPGATTALQQGGDWTTFVWSTAIVGSWGFAYEAFMTASAAQLREALGPDGVSFWSGAMVINVVGCSLLGVAVARWIDDPRRSVPAGVALLLVGATAAVAVPGSRGLVVAGIGLVTLGELVFTATSQFVWMSLLPRSSRPGTVFAAASGAVSLLRALGGALAFPLVVGSGHPALGMIALVLPALALCGTATPVWRAFRAL